jgi:hypothetical protein
MEGFGLHDDQWDRIKYILPGREGHVGGPARNNRLFIEAILYRFRNRYSVARSAGALLWDSRELMCPS